MHYSKQYSLLIIFIAIILSSCSTSIEENTLDKLIRDNDADGLKALIYNRQKIDKKKFTKLIELYSTSIKEKNLIAKPIQDESLKSLWTGRKRLGFEYYDEEGNLHHSITYKLIIMPEDSSVQYNYIDFRDTDQKLPSLKVPGFGAIRPIYSEQFKKRIAKTTIDSLEAIGPINLYGYDFHHVNSVDYQNKFLPKDSVKSAIVININNNYLKSHIDIVMKELAQKVNLNNYDLAYMETTSTPTLRIGFDAGFNPRDLKTMTEYFVEKLGKGNLILSPQFKKEFTPFTGNCYIGHSYVEKKRIRLF